MTKGMNLYANLANKHKTKKDKKSRERAEYLASLPKHPVKRLLYRLHPKRVFKYWFSKRGGIMLLKILAVSVLLGILMIGVYLRRLSTTFQSIMSHKAAKWSTRRFW